MSTAGWEEKVLVRHGAAERVAQYRVEVETGRFIEQLLEASGKTQRSIAAMARVPEPNLTRIKRGEILPSLDTIARLTWAALGVGLELRLQGRRSKQVEPIVLRFASRRRKGILARA
ncbi:MAG TPA: helix-turn-helix transcriptional regulator [bacterium]|nr:helix-turn-helix transcriptional regulator [bacterium]